MQNITFTCQVLRGTNKAGILKPDADGYYTVLLGGFNIHNETGSYYPWNKYLQDIFLNHSSAFMRRITRGHLRGERGHPVRTAEYANDNLWFSRLREIRQSNWSHHIRNVTIDFENYRSQHNEKMVAVIGEIRPYDTPIGRLLKDSLDNPSEDTCFSVRTLTLDTPLGGMCWSKDVYECVTWDWVHEPGVRNATKFHSPGLESLQETKFDPQVLKNHLHTVQNMPTGVGMESNEDFSTLKSIMKDYEAGEGSPVLRPASLRWK